MNTKLLSAVTDEFAAYLSEVTDGDLGHPTPCGDWTIGDLYRHVLDENVKFGRAVSDSPPPRESQRPCRETMYRATARYMENGFARVADVGELRHVDGLPGDRTIAELFEMQVADTMIHTWDLARSVAIEFEPNHDVVELVLARMRQIPDAARGAGKPFGPARRVPDEDISSMEEILLLSGRDTSWHP